jgi:hypothetical protein
MTRASATAPKRSRAWSMPRTRPVSAEPTVARTTRIGNHASSRWKSESRASHARSPTTGLRVSTAAATAGSVRRTPCSPPVAVTDRAAQCCKGNASAAAAKLQYAHSTETGAATSAPRARVTVAKKT